MSSEPSFSMISQSVAEKVAQHKSQRPRDVIEGLSRKSTKSDIGRDWGRPEPDDAESQVWENEGGAVNSPRARRPFSERWQDRSRGRERPTLPNQRLISAISSRLLMSVLLALFSIALVGTFRPDQGGQNQTQYPGALTQSSSMQ
ncbi:MAG: hypothetical protein AAAC47_05345 [Pararhizobium sp.]